MKNPNAPVPIRLEAEQQQMLTKLKQATNLSKSFIIRRCLAHSLPLFAADQLDLLTLRTKDNTAPPAQPL